jgi:hypothetical protein
VGALEEKKRFKIKVSKLRGLIKKNATAQDVYLAPLQANTIEAPILEQAQRLVEDNDSLFQEPTDIPTT